jgi:hypothetical protein
MAGAPPPRTVLVVETASFGSGDLVAAAQLQLARAPCRFYVLIPVLGSRGNAEPHGALSWMLTRSPADKWIVDKADRVSRSRLDAEIRRLRQLGARTDGDVVYGSLQQDIRGHIRRGVRTVIVSEPARRVPILSIARQIRLRYRVEVIEVRPY